MTGSLVALTGVWSATAVYAGVFWCFHFGLIATLASGYISTIDLPLGDESWVVGPFSGDAAILALAGTLAFASGACFVYWRRGSFDSERAGDYGPERRPIRTASSAPCSCSARSRAGASSSSRREA